MLVIAHRGYSAKAPENTLAAFELALDVGCHGLELDVQLTKDDEIVIIHDHTLGRTTNGSGSVQAHTLAELKKLDAGSWFDPKFKNERLPTLGEVCELIRGEDVILNVELKVALGFEGLVEKVVALLEGCGLQERTIISSFNHYALAYAKEAAPEIKTGVLYMAGLFNPWVYAQSLGATALHPFYQTIVPDIVAESQKNGMMVNPFTIDDPKDVERMLAAKVDSVITNEPERVLGML